MSLQSNAERPRTLPARVAPAQLTQSGERELSSIVTDMWENGEKLARQEVALALAELKVRTDKFTTTLVQGAITGAVYNAGVLVLLAAVVLGLSEVMAPWLAALIVGVLALGAGYALQKNAAQRAIDKEKERTQATTGSAMKEGTQ